MYWKNTCNLVLFIIPMANNAKLYAVLFKFVGTMFKYGVDKLTSRTFCR